MAVKPTRVSGGDEAFVSPRLTRTKQAAFVVRAGEASQDAIGSRASLDRSASELEIQLQKAGFVVRDRQLVEVRLRQASSATDYARIADETGIEFILEIANIKIGNVSGLKLYEVVDGQLAKSLDTIKTPQYEVTVDVIRVRDNTRAGRLVGTANFFTMAKAANLWPLADPAKESPVTSYEPEHISAQMMSAVKQVPGVTCKGDYSPVQCAFTDSSPPVRFALADIAAQLSDTSAL